MKEQSIQFSTEMVCSILSGKKTQMRRVINPQPNETSCFNIESKNICQGNGLPEIQCPHGKINDRLICTPSNWEGQEVPDWASRYCILEITNIRVERLQDITEEDAAKEGFDCDNHGQIQIGEEIIKIANKGFFKFYWECLYEIGSWDLNHWVWVIEFKKI